MTEGYGHYLVVTGIDDNYVYVNDSACATNATNRKYTKESFLKVWGTDKYGINNYFRGVLIAPENKELPIGIVKQSLPNDPAKVGETYTVKLGAVFGNRLQNNSFVWSKIEGQLPLGLELRENGEITGVPTTEGVYDFTIGVTDGYSKADAKTSIIVSQSAVSPPLRITTPQNFETSEVGYSFEMQLTASGGKLPYSWLLINGHMPEGIALVNDNIKGIPSESGNFSFTIQLRDGSQSSATRTFNLSVLPSNTYKAHRCQEEKRS